MAACCRTSQHQSCCLFFAAWPSFSWPLEPCFDLQRPIDLWSKLTAPCPAKKVVAPERERERVPSREEILIYPLNRQAETWGTSRSIKSLFLFLKGNKPKRGHQETTRFSTQHLIFQLPFQKPSRTAGETMTIGIGRAPCVLLSSNKAYFSGPTHTTTPTSTPTPPLPPTPLPNPYPYPTHPTPQTRRFRGFGGPDSLRSLRSLRAAALRLQGALRRGALRGLLRQPRTQRVWSHGLDPGGKQPVDGGEIHFAPPFRNPGF